MNKAHNKSYRYKWIGITSQGKKVSGETSAPNKKSAITQIQHQNILILKLYKSLFHLDIIPKKIPPLVILNFIRQLAALMAAGVPIVQSLIILKQTHDHQTFQPILATIKIDIESGHILATSLRKYPRFFDSFTCQLIQIGEQTGTLTTILQRIATYKEKNLALKKKIIQSLFYPALILIVALLVSFIMLTYVVPRFAELFQNTHHALPALTVFVINTSNYIRSYGWLIPTIPLILTILANFAKTKFRTKHKIDLLALKIPYFKTISSKTYWARFARYLAIAYYAGLPVTEALKMLAETANNTVYQHSIHDLHAEILKGQALHKSMQKIGTFPQLMTQMVKIGEESGMLANMLEKMADIYESDIDYFMSHFTQTIEPLIMIILGVLIGGLVIAMYLPIFKLGNLM